MGWKTQDMLDGIDGIMNLAAASGEDLATTSDIVTDALTGFGLSAADSSHFADVLASASSNANTNVGMLGESFKYVAPLAGAMKYSAEDTAIALGIMANSGIKASQAGTALRGAISSMLKPSENAANAMERYGISLIDSSGNAKSLKDVMGNLRTAFGQMTEAEKTQVAATIFGTEAMSGMLAIINASEEDYNKLTDSIYNCDGAAQTMAETMQNNLQGKITQFKSALEGAGIAIGEILIPALTKIVVKATDILSSFNNLDEGTQKMILKFGLIAAAIGPFLTIAGKLTMGVGGIVKGFSLLSSGVSTAISAMGGFGSAISLLTGPIGIITAVIVAAVAAWKTNFAGFRDACESIFEDLGRIFDVIKEKISTLWANIKNAWDTDLGGIQTILTTAWENFTTICGAAFQAIADLFDLFADAFEGDWQGVWDNVFNIFNGIFDGLQTAFSNSLNALITVLDGWFPGLGEKLGSLTDIFNNTWNFVQEACNIGIENVRLTFEALGMILEGDFQGALDLFKERWGEAWEAIKTSVSDSKETIITKVGELKEDIITKLTELKEEAPQKTAEMKENIIEKVSELKTQAEQKFTEIKETITTKVKEAVEKASEFFAQLPDKIAYSLGYALGTIVGWCTEMYNTLTTKVKAAIESVSQWFSQLPGKIQTFLQNALSNIKTWASNIATSAAQAGKQFVSNVSDAIKELPGKIKSFLDSALSAIGSFATNAASKALSAGQNICNKVVSGIKSLPGKVAEIGKQVPSAIYNAIVNAGANLGSQITSWVKGKIDSAIQGAKDAIANFKLFATGTENAPEGLAEVAEYGPELIVSRSGAGAYLATDRQLINLEGGERIYNARQTSEILNKMQNYSSNDDSDLLRTLILKVDTTNKILQEKEFNKITENMIHQVDVNGVTDIKDITDQITRYIDKRTI